MPIIQNLQRIHDQNFRKASLAVGKYQARYKKQYDARNKVKAFDLKVGDRVQYCRYLSKKTKSKSYLSKWIPLKSYHLIFEINFSKKKVVLQTREGIVLKRTQSFDSLRKYRGR